ncbi:MAG: cytochrome c peroxidase, partial [Polyangiales bacterium]
MGGHIIPLLCVVHISCAQPQAMESVERERLPPPLHATANDPFEPIPNDLEYDEQKVELGRRLFEDSRLSGDGTRACVDCHHLDHGGVVPGESRSNHPLNATGPYNVPTVFNVAFNFRFNWQGRFETMEEHLDGPMMNEDVMDAGSWRDVVQRLRSSYRDAFVAAGYDGVTEVSVRDAIVEYQRSLVTPGSRFDRFLLEELELTESEQ